MWVETFELVVRVCSWIIVAFCFLMGLGLLVAPKAIVKLSRVLNRFFSTERLREAIEKVVDSDQWIVGHRITVGIIALVVSIIIFLQIR